MGAQAHRFFRHCHFVRKDGRFLEQAAFVQGHIAQQLVHPGSQLLVIFPHGLGGAFFHKRHTIQNGLCSPGHIGLHLGALYLTHGNKLIQRSGCHRLHIGPNLVLVLLCLAHHQYIRKAGNSGSAPVLLRTIGVCNLLQCGVVSTG